MPGAPISNESTVRYTTEELTKELEERESEGRESINEVDLDHDGNVTIEEKKLFIEKIRSSKGFHFHAVNLANQFAEELGVKPIVGNGNFQLAFNYIPLTSERSTIRNGYAFLKMFEEGPSQENSANVEMAALLTTSILFGNSPGEFLIAEVNFGSGLFGSHLRADRIVLEDDVIARDKKFATAGPMFSAGTFVGIDPFSVVEKLPPLYLGLKATGEGHMGIVSYQDIEGDEGMPISLGAGLDVGIVTRLYIPLPKSASCMTLELGLPLYHGDLDVVTSQSMRSGLYITLGYGGQGGAPFRFRSDPEE